MPLIIELKVNPSSGQSKISLDKSGIIKCYLKSPPEDGKANRELLKFWADALGIAARDIDIVSGLISRKKKIKINTLLTLQEVMHKLGLDLQRSLT